MGLNTRFTVGSVILAILLLSIFGVSRAFRSLTGNAPEERIESSRVDAFTDSNEPEASSQTTNQNDAQNDAQIPDPRTRNEAGELEFTPLQTAGTFIQRQQRIEEDSTVSDTEVSVVAVADSPIVDSTPIPAQGDTITTDQSETTSTPDTTPATSPAVPALW